MAVIIGAKAMPIYEYACAECGRQVSLLILNIHNPPPVRCPHCGGQRLERLLSRFARLRSDTERLEDLAGPGRLGGLDENDPDSIRRWVARAGKELGDDLGENLDPMMEETLGDEGDADPSG